MKRINNLIKCILISCLCMLMLMVGSSVVTAEENEESDVTFILTYPDGSTETVDNKQDAIAKLDEWKLLYEGETDPAGIIKLEEWAKAGEIKIEEMEVPKGYTAETTVTYVDLKDEEVVIVNNKDEEPEKPEPEKPKPEKPEPEKPKKKPEIYKVPVTGIE